MKRPLEDFHWTPLLREKLVILALVDQFKILYDKHRNPFFVWLARALAKHLPQNHPKVDIKWIEDYIDELQGRIFDLLSNPPKDNFTRAAGAALGFDPTPGKGSGTPASKARTILDDENLAVQVIALLPTNKEYLAIEIVAKNNETSVTTVSNALHYRRKTKRRRE